MPSIEEGKEEEENTPLLKEETESSTINNDQEGVASHQEEDKNVEGISRPNDNITTNERTSTNDDRPEPPSYESLFGKMKDCTDEAINAFDFMHNSTNILLQTSACTVVMIIMLALPITSIVLGSLYMNQCPKQHYIPIYLIVVGSFSIFQQILNVLVRFTRKEDNDSGNKHLSCDCCQCFRSIINTFVFMWFIAGNIWIYSAYTPDFTDRLSPDFCHKTLYLFAFWMTTAVYIVLALSCCCISCIACGSACFTVFRER